MTPRPLLRAALRLACLLALAPAPHPAPAQAPSPSQPQTPAQEKPESQEKQEKQEKPVCPWLTEGTATATLGTPVTTAVTLHGDPDRPEGTCLFTAPQGTLEIAVIAVITTPSEPACPTTGLKLPGIGNEATFCHTDNRDRITSRVRDLSFRTTLSLQPPTPQPDAKQQEAHQHQLERIAEQVAGNLF
jgi:hypothetical protein